MVGIGSIAGIKNDLTAVSELANFDVPLSISVINRAQDWASRQKIEYAAQVSLIAADFLSLKDYKFQITQYSHANLTQLHAPLAVVTPLADKNLLFQTKLFPDPELGLRVGSYLLSLPFFADVFVAEPELVTDQQALAGSLGV